ncbi:UDP-N-acetylglucosamine--N-acetylmuramyl-(pentapeptide) pyrophosphoryl-undecaprenol N-acetylglucosamine transferase [Candidatus Uhrbacteria bacterium]|nr:UDP-N-acetylglucosamine--N-acetylmuramyl-(pentapeptide) pyrophosphoryl-undecaprenol N-acetylglucosamine transferase [Candidatus Uhrbacteria bacterium]
MKILLAGGGTLGPVMPLLAAAEAWHYLDSETACVWAGTPDGPERELVEGLGMRFYPVSVARLARYPSWEWARLLGRFMRSLMEAWQILKAEQPSLIASAGGYTAVPLVIAGRLRGIPSWIHQQDAVPSLTNRLLAPFAPWITVAWEETLTAFPGKKTSLVGNPVRASLVQFSKKEALARFSLNEDLPTLLVLGGGGGSRWINQQVHTLRPWLVEHANVIHLTGRGKMEGESVGYSGTGTYLTAELLTETMPYAWAAADLVVSRAGMGTLSELAAQAKPSILIPLPHSPQERNAALFEEAGAAAILSQAEMDVGTLKKTIDALLADPARRNDMGQAAAHCLKTEPPMEFLERLLRETEPKG